MFLLPNGNKIDDEGVIDALTDYTNSKYYFLDSLTGEVGIVTTRQIKKLQRLCDDNRYFKIPKAELEAHIKCLKDFLDTMLSPKSKLARDIKKYIETKDSETALVLSEQILKKDKEGWIHGWVQWQGDFLYEEMTQWFLTLPVNIVDKFEGCSDCELCKLFEKDEQTVEDFSEAVKKQKNKKKRK